jgi:serine/threonine protein kinase
MDDATWYVAAVRRSAVTRVKNPSQSAVRVLLLREVATGPVAAAFVAERWTQEGSSLAVVKVLREPTPAQRVLDVHQASMQLGALKHRHIVAVDQVVAIDGRFGLISPYVDGMDLLDWMGVLREKDIAMPPRVVCEMLRGIAVTLDAAQHRIPWGEDRALGLAHGDLKPGNIMVDRDGELKVLDFCTGASALSAGLVVRSARTYMAPERTSGDAADAEGAASAAADVYALGIIGIELLGERWLHSLPSEAEAHDTHLADTLKTFDFSMRSTADEQTLRSLLLRMVAHAPRSRPRAAVVAQTLRRLADRAPGPSLESFAHEYMLPWLRNAPEDPDTGLMVQVSPVSVDLEMVSGPEPDGDTNTAGPGEFGRMLDDQAPPAFLVDSRSWDREMVDLSDTVADATEKALEAARQARMLDRALSIDSSLEPYDPEADDHEPTDAVVDLAAVRAQIETIEAEVVYSPPDPAPSRSIPRTLFLAVAVVAMLVGALIALVAVLVGGAAGLYVASLYV